MGEDKPFTVRDRRLFTSDGERRTEESAASEVAEAAPPGPPPSEPPPREQGEGVDFASFIASLAGQASMLLSAEGEELAASLPDARQMISILEMLEDKTRGRRTPEEDGLMQQILYELRMAYVARSRGVGA